MEVEVIPETGTRFRAVRTRNPLKTLHGVTALCAATPWDFGLVREVKIFFLELDLTLFGDPLPHETELQERIAMSMLQEPPPMPLRLGIISSPLCKKPAKVKQHPEIGILLFN